MRERTVVHSTFVLERSYPTTPVRVFAAFADPARKRRWFAEGEGFEIDEYELDLRVGGIERTRFRFQGGPSMSYDAIYQDIVPERRIVLVYTMAIGDIRISSSLATVELFGTQAGTDLIYTEQGAYFHGPDSVRAREEGSRELLEALALELDREGALTDGS